MGILSENIEAGHPLRHVTYIRVKGAGGWCNTTTTEKIGKLMIPGLDIDPNHIAHLVKEVLLDEIRYYGGLWHRPTYDVKFKVFYNGYENEICISVYVDDDKWCSVRVTRNNRRENPINFINLKGAVYDLR